MVGTAMNDGDRRRSPGAARPAAAIEAAGELADRAVPERARQDVDDAVGVIEREHVERTVVLPPLPRFTEARDLRLQVGVRQHDALRAARGAARVEHQGATVRRDRRQERPLAWRRRGERARRRRGDPDAPRGSQRFEGRGVIGRGDNLGGPAVVEDVLPFAGCLLRGQGHRHAAGHPRPPLPRHVRRARRRQQRDARLVEIGAILEQIAGHGGAPGGQIAVGAGAGPIHDGGAAGILPRAPDEPGQSVERHEAYDSAVRRTRQSPL